jgi:LuxR family maltose regulon positive regulatory protein
MVMEELYVKGYLKSFNSELLAFRPEEVLGYLRLCGIDDGDFAKSVWRSSEGWASALRLHADEFLRSGQLASDTVFHHFFESSVFADYPEHLRRLLIKLSVLEEFTAEEAAHVAEEPGAAALLTELIDRGGFVSFAPKTKAWRFHNLFRSYCLMHLEAGPGHAGLLRRVADWHLSRSDSLAAVDILRKAGRDQDWERLLGLFEDRNFQLEYQQSNSAVRPDPGELIALVPWQVTIHKPFGYVALAFNAALQLGLEAGHRLLRSAEEVFSKAGYDQLTLDRILANIIYVRSILSFQNIRSSLSSLAKAPQVKDMKKNALVCGFCWTLESPHVGFLHHTEAGGYERLLDDLGHLWPSFSSFSGGWGFGGLSLLKAEWLLETGRFEQALILAESSRVEAECYDQKDIILAGTFLRLRALLALRRIGEAQVLIASLPYSDGDEKSLGLTGSIIKGYLRANFGTIDGLENWLDYSCEFIKSAWTRHGLSFGFIVLGRALALRHEHHKLLGLTKFLNTIFGNRQTVIGLVHCLLLEAIARWNQEGSDAGLRSFREAVELAAPDNLILIPGEYGRLVIPLLKQARDEEAFLKWRDYLEDVLHLARTFELAGKPLDKASPCKLTLRERNFLDQVIKGRSNQQIAELYKIKRVTVSKALSNAYRKLGAKNRSQAIHNLLSR